MPPERDENGRFVKTGGDGNNPQPKSNTGLPEGMRQGENGFEMEVKVDGEKQYVPMEQAQELIQKGQHYTVNMQEARRLQKEYQQKLQAFQSGGQGVGNDSSNSHQGPAPGSGVGQGDGGGYQSGPSQDPPDPVEEPEKYKAHIKALEAKVGQAAALQQELQTLKAQQAKYANEIEREHDHKYLNAQIDGYDKQAVEEELETMRSEDPEVARRMDCREGMELIFRRLQDEGKISKKSKKEKGNQASPQRKTPYSQGARNAPPASDGSAPQYDKPPANEEEALERYVEYNRNNARGG